MPTDINSSNWMESLNAVLWGSKEFRQGTLLEFWLALVTSFIVGICFYFAYKLYYRKNEPYDPNIARSMPLISPAVTAIFWIIQFSLPLSLGLLGALSFVRFRTPVKRAEDIAFILLLIGSGLACAVGQTLTALLLVLHVGLYGIVRNNLIHLRSWSPSQLAILTINSSMEADPHFFLGKLQAAAKPVSLVSSSTFDGIQSIVFHVPRMTAQAYESIGKTVREIDKNARLDVFYPSNQLGA